MLTLAGNATPKVAIYKSESYKLHQAFPIATGEVILPGYPVGLDSEGKAVLYRGTGVFLGIAVNDSQAKLYDNKKSTVMVEGYAVIYGISGGVINPGYVVPGNANSENAGYIDYTASGETTPAVKASDIQADQYKIEAVTAGAAGNSLTYTVAVDGTGEATVVKTDNNIAITLLSTAKTVGDLITLLAANTYIRATLNGTATNATVVTAVSSAAALENGADAVTTAVETKFIALTKATAAGQLVQILVR